jgi:hypothetical protein
MFTAWLRLFELTWRFIGPIIKVAVNTGLYDEAEALRVMLILRILRRWGSLND